MSDGAPRAPRRLPDELWDIIARALSAEGTASADRALHVLAAAFQYARAASKGAYVEAVRENVAALEARHPYDNGVAICDALRADADRPEVVECSVRRRSATDCLARSKDAYHAVRVAGAAGKVRTIGALLDNFGSAILRDCGPNDMEVLVGETIAWKLIRPADAAALTDKMEAAFGRELIRQSVHRCLVAMRGEWLAAERTRQAQVRAMHAELSKKKGRGRRDVLWPLPPPSVGGWGAARVYGRFYGWRDVDVKSVEGASV